MELFLSEQNALPVGYKLQFISCRIFQITYREKLDSLQTECGNNDEWSLSRRFCSTRNSSELM